MEATQTPSWAHHWVGVDDGGGRWSWRQRPGGVAVAEGDDRNATSLLCIPFAIARFQIFFKKRKLWTHGPSWNVRLIWWLWRLERQGPFGTLNRGVYKSGRFRVYATLSSSPLGNIPDDGAHTNSPVSTTSLKNVVSLWANGSPLFLNFPYSRFSRVFITHHHNIHALNINLRLTK